MNRFFAKSLPQYVPQAVNNYVLNAFVLEGRPIKSEQLSTRLLQLTGQRMGAGLNLNQYRQVAIALMEMHIIGSTQGGGSGDHLDDNYEDDNAGNNETATDDITDLQAGHSTLMRASHYGRSQYDSRFIDRRTLQDFYIVSAKWQRLLSVGEDGVLVAQEATQAPIEVVLPRAVVHAPESVGASYAVIAAEESENGKCAT